MVNHVKKSDFNSWSKVGRFVEGWVDESYLTLTILVVSLVFLGAYAAGEGPGEMLQVLAITILVIMCFLLRVSNVRIEELSHHSGYIRTDTHNHYSHHFLIPGTNREAMLASGLEEMTIFLLTREIIRQGLRSKNSGWFVETKRSTMYFPRSCVEVLQKSLQQDGTLELRCIGSRDVEDENLSITKQHTQYDISHLESIVARKTKSYVRKVWHHEADELEAGAAAQEELYQKRLAATNNGAPFPDRADPLD